MKIRQNLHVEDAFFFHSHTESRVFIACMNALGIDIY